MTTESFHTSDITILDLLRRMNEGTVSELADEMQVTATAIRRRLQRLMLQGLVVRTDRRQSRGRPTHGYRLTPSGRRKAGENFADLATARWEEVRSIDDTAIRHRLIEGIAKRLARMYSRQVHGESLQERMSSIAALFGERQIPVAVETVAVDSALPGSGLPGSGLPGSGDSEAAASDGAQEAGAGEARSPQLGRSLPVLSVLACPYPDLSNGDDSICVMERTLLSELVGTELALGECTVAGGNCCRFAVVDSAESASRVSGASQ